MPATPAPITSALSDFFSSMGHPFEGNLIIRRILS
jgi:hypothetical protein